MSVILSAIIAGQTAGLGSSNGFVVFYRSSLGKKIVMAVTGLMLIGFVVMHLLGNLQIFLGPDQFNAYAHFLKSIPEFLWMARILLIVAFCLHVFTAFSLKKINRTARPVSYRDKKNIQLDPASQYMLETGIIILLFIVMHLMHFTFGALQPEYYNFVDEKGRHDVYRMVIEGFQNGPYVFIYVVSMIALSLHLRHAFWSMFQSVGAYSPELGVCLKRASKFLAAIVALAYSSIPLAAQFGLLN